MNRKQQGWIVQENMLFDLCLWFSDELRELMFRRCSGQVEAEAQISVVVLIKWEVLQLQDRIIKGN